jgi:hypothetical protein
MKGWSANIVFSLALIILSAAAVQAQDAGMSDVEIVDEHNAVDGEKLIYLPGEDVRYVPTAPSQRLPQDSVLLHMHDFPMQQATMRAPDKANEKQAKSKDDSILTFNFLYYMIQKYKLQDIID